MGWTSSKSLQCQFPKQKFGICHDISETKHTGTQTDRQTDRIDGSHYASCSNFFTKSVQIIVCLVCVQKTKINAEKTGCFFFFGGGDKLQCREVEIKILVKSLMLASSWPKVFKNLPRAFGYKKWKQQNQ